MTIEALKAARDALADATSFRTKRTRDNVHKIIAQADAALAAPSAEPVAKDLVPGVMACAKCKFRLQRMVMCAETGAVGVQDNHEPEHCPNGCGPLWPVTWEQEAHELGNRLEHFFDRAIAAEKALNAPAQPPAPQPVALPEKWLQGACDKIEQALLEHKLSEWHEDGDETSPFPLLDHLSHSNSTATGRREIEMIVETIYYALKEFGEANSPTTSVEAEPVPGQAAGGDKLLRQFLAEAKAAGVERLSIPVGQAAAPSGVQQYMVGGWLLCREQTYPLDAAASRPQAGAGDVNGRPPIDKAKRARDERLRVLEKGLIACYEIIERIRKEMAELTNDTARRGAK